jgi:hypothetical protein
MIRAICAWVLVVLATSPVTAPFSSCDLRAFLAPTSSVSVPSIFPSTAMSAPLSIDGDANSLSPVVPRHELSGGDSGVLVMLLFYGVTPGGTGTFFPHEINLSPHDRMTGPTVLRL